MEVGQDGVHVSLQVLTMCGVCVSVILEVLVSTSLSWFTAYQTWYTHIAETTTDKKQVDKQADREQGHISCLNQPFFFVAVLGRKREQRRKIERILKTIEDTR